MEEYEKLFTRPLLEILSQIDPRGASPLINVPVRHILKSWPLYFKPMRQGLKRFDIRHKKDRLFEPGQYILHREWSPTLEKYSGAWDLYHVQYVLHGEMLKIFGHPGLDDLVVMDLIHVLSSTEFFP